MLKNLDKQPVGLIDRAEAVYLRILRWLAIIVATVMLLYAGWNGLSSAFSFLQTLQTVQIAPVTVSAADMIAAATPEQSNAVVVNPVFEAKKAKLPPSIYDEHAKKMYAVWKADFEQYRPAGDAALTFKDFSEWYRTEYINGTLRKHDVVDWVLYEERAKSDLESSVETLAQSAKDPGVVARMKAYQAGKSSDEFWDRYDQTFMRLTDGYWVTLKAKREAELLRAETKQAGLIAKADLARTSFIYARNGLIGFLGLMFFFLIVAMERHQRHIATELARLKLEREDAL